MKQNYFTGLFLIAIAMGCDTNQVTTINPPKIEPGLPASPPAVAPPTISLTQDPAAHFKLLINRFVDLIKKPDNRDFDGAGREAWQIQNYIGAVKSLTYDVRKTDSLVSPFIATAEITFIQYNEPEKVGGKRSLSLTICEFSVPAQEGKWIYRDPTYKCFFNHDLSGPSKLTDVTHMQTDINKGISANFEAVWGKASTPE